MRIRRFLPVFVLLFVSLLAATAAAAQPIAPVPPPPPPQFEGLRIDYQYVDITIDDQIATTHIEQLFVNENDWLLESTYLFPLPKGAAVSQLTMWVNGQPIDAKILEKGEARQIYDEIVRQLRDPALLEYVDHDAIQANVFPIPAGEERLIEIEYSQLLPADNGLIHYVYPQSTNLYTNVPLDEQRIRVEIESEQAVRAIYSPSHPVDIFRDGENRAVVGYEAQNVTPEGDFGLFYTVSPEEIGLNLLSYRAVGEDGFFTMLIAPSIATEEIVAKDVILVLDTSGSMDGEKLTQAQDAANYVISHLNPEDHFNIVSFSTDVRLFEDNLIAPAAAEQAAAYINRLAAVGGTNISTALLEAASLVANERPTTIIFLTDGLATEGITDTGLLLNAVANELPANARIFAFGVGNDVDPNLLDSLTETHRGTTTYVRPGERIDEVVSSFYAKISSPVLSNIDLEVDGVKIEQVYPTTLPDLFAGTQLTLVGRYRDGGSATITLSGDVNGRSQTFTYPDQNFNNAGGDEFIPRLWATRAIGHMLREIRLHGENTELVQSVINLSTRYGIITPYTSFLIEEDDIAESLREQPAAEGMAVLEGEPVEVTRVVTESIVEEAAAESMMAAAEAPMALSTAAANDQSGTTTNAPIQAVGSKTFVRQNDVWVDTAYDSESHTLTAIDFASDAYFNLLATEPILGQYFALGQQVLVVVDDAAYQILAEPTAEHSVSSESEGPATLQPVQTTDTETNLPDNDNTPLDAEPDIPRPNMCGALLAMPLLLGFGGVVSWYGRRRQ